MKIVGIGDLFIPSKYIKTGFEQSEKEYGLEVSVLDWKLAGFDELQNINLLVEQSGAEAYDVPDYIIDAVKDADIIVTQFCPITKKVIDRCEKLKIIGVLRAGCENVNSEYAKKKGITVVNTPGRNSDAVADFAVGMMICEARNIARGHYGLKNGQWIRNYPNSDYIPDFPGRTVGLIGYGEIGRKVEKRLQGFDMKVIVYDPFMRGEPEFGRKVDLDTLLSESDFVTIHARLSKDNEKMIGERELGLMKKTAYLINTSRAGLIDEKALYRALKSNKIAGAAIDVFELEPPGKDYPLVTLPNITVTPHMAGGSKDAFFNTPKKLANIMQKYFI